ncbi:hypothetical protein KCU83_g575, partial [Aureobasidium melanogenum]
MMARDIRTARFDLEFRLLRAFVVCWMTDPRQNYPFDHPERAEKMRKMALAQTGPENLITQDTGFITVLRKEGDEDYNPDEDLGLEAKEREQVKRHRLVTEVLYPRQRLAHAPRQRLALAPVEDCAVPERPAKRKRGRSRSIT